ncbi:MAG TPA: DMT family transporter, partial [Candidatus Latescibacteria bacterium]|nr:DMT family transporter [Candidatus Latescibacterota bacterium]
LSRKYGALNTTAFTIILGTVPLLVGADADLVHKAAALPAGFWAADLFLGLGCTAAAYLLWTKALQVMEATKVAVFLYLIPVLGIAWGWLYLDEPVSWWLVAGAALVIFGVVLANRKAVAPAPVN